MLILDIGLCLDVECGGKRLSILCNTGPPPVVVVIGKTEQSSDVERSSELLSGMERYGQEDPGQQDWLHRAIGVLKVCRQHGQAKVYVRPDSRPRLPDDFFYYITDLGDPEENLVPQK